MAFGGMFGEMGRALGGAGGAMMGGGGGGRMQQPQPRMPQQQPRLPQMQGLGPSMGNRQGPMMPPWMHQGGGGQQMPWMRGGGFQAGPWNPEMPYNGGRPLPQVQGPEGQSPNNTSMQVPPWMHQNTGVTGGGGMFNPGGPMGPQNMPAFMRRIMQNNPMPEGPMPRELQQGDMMMNPWTRKQVPYNPNVMY